MVSFRLFSIAAVAAYASICDAAVWSSIPVADPTAYRRLATLGKSIVLGTHKLTIPKIPNVSCGNTCAIEFFVDMEGDEKDFYSHPFTISATGVATISATSGIIADKSAPVPLSGGMTPNGATPDGPITLVQNAAKGAQSVNHSSAAQLDTPALVATIAASLVVSALSMTWVL
ncbi:hypothetical protein BG003_008574 [Podila horticola]|nr:hypothetical protein BG003_008574 [Podila horticola]